MHTNKYCAFFYFYLNLETKYNLEKNYNEKVFCMHPIVGKINSSDQTFPEMRFVSKNEIASKFYERTKIYQGVLELPDEDIERLERAQTHTSCLPNIQEIGEKGFLTLTIDDEKFGLSVHDTYGADYERSWEKCIVATCLTNSALNQGIGYGTSLINIVPDEWHKKIIETMQNDR